MLASQMSLAGAATAISFAASFSSGFFSSASASSGNAASTITSQAGPRTWIRIRMPPSVQAAASARRPQHVLAVVTQLADGFAYVLERDVRALFLEARGDLGHPAARQLFERAHVQVAIVKVTLERRHQA